MAGDGSPPGARAVASLPVASLAVVVDGRGVAVFPHQVETVA